MKMKNATYDVLKKVSLLCVPLVTFVAALSEIWGFPGTEICATISAAGLFLGAVLEISTKQYNADMVEHADDDEGKG